MVRATLELSAFVHSTEDERKVLDALLNTVPADLRPVVAQRVRVQSLEGYYGNVIKIVRLTISGSQAEEALRYLLCGMGRRSRELLLATLESRVERRRARVHIRLSKQDLFLGRLVLSEGDDVVKIVASFEGARRGSLAAVLEDIGGSCGD